MSKTKGMRNRKKEMGVGGVGPKIIVPMVIMLALTGWISYVYRPTFDISFLPRELTLALGGLLLLLGIPLWLWSITTFLAAFQKGRLATGGPYAVMLNPVYSSWIVFIVPGIALLLNFWLVLATSIVMYLCQMRFIHEEDDHLRQKFGKQYEEYRKKVLIKFL
jgi:protein-S-isoprenylcysteine O-methyltransferase Ste14